MNFLDKLKVGARLGAGFALMGFFLILVSVTSLARMSALNNELDRVTNLRFKRVALVIDAQKLIHENGRSSLLMTIESDPAEYERLVSLQNNNKDAISKYFGEVQSLMESEEEKRLFAKVVAARVAYVGSFTRVKELVKADRNSARQVAAAEMAPALGTFVATMEDFLAK